MFQQALGAINKKFSLENGDEILRVGGENTRKVPTVSSGSLVLDSITGGIPVGRVVTVMGPEASGKTSMALNVIANVQKQGGYAAFIDLENALDPVYAGKLGVDMKTLVLAQPDYAEQALQLTEDLASTGVIDVIVVDSVAALVPKAEWEGELEDQNMALVARILGKSLRKLIGTARRNSTTVIFINQLREKIGVFYGNPETSPGGRALKYFSSQIIDVRRAGQVKEGDAIIGTEVRLKVTKNKTWKPFGVGTTVLTFDKGINRPAEMIQEGPKYGVITRNGNTYYETATEEKIGLGRAKAIAALENNPEMYDRLSKALMAKLTEKEENRTVDEDSVPPADE